MNLSPEITEMFANAMTPKFLATVGGEGVPNVVPITSLMPASKDTVIFGDFLMWKTAKNLENHSKVGILVLTEALKYVYVSGTLQGFEKAGPNVDRINQQDLFRYNAYTGIRRAGIIKVESVTEISTITKLQIMFGLVKLRLHHSLAKGYAVMPYNVLEKYSRTQALKVIAYIGPEGYPLAVPAMPMVAKDEHSLSFILKSSLSKLAEGTKVAACVLTLEPICYQVKGTVKGSGAIKDIALTDVYSACPPLVGKKIG